MFKTIRILMDLLTEREKKTSLILLAFMLSLAILEMLSVASIYPLISVISNPEIIQQNEYLRFAYDFLSFKENFAFFIFLTSVVLIITVLRTTLSILTNYLILRYAQMRAHRLSVVLLGNYLHRPYAWFLNRHSADMAKSVFSEVEQVVSGSLMPMLQIVASSLILFFMIGLIIAVDPLVAVVGLVGTVLSYGGIYVLVRGHLLTKGKERIEANQQRFKVAQEALAGIKEIKISSSERAYTKLFETASYRFSRIKYNVQLIRELPRSLLELIAVGGMLIIIILFLKRHDGSLMAALPLMSLYAFTALRLLPTVQIFYRSFVSLRFGQPALMNLHADLIDDDRVTDFKKTFPLKISNKIELQSVSYSYPESDRVALKDISLTIEAGTTVGFIGPSGAGKSTIIDILTGLLEPQSGIIKIDDTPLTSQNLRAWQHSLGYVQQSFFLTDETIASNIALGVSPSKIDMEAVKNAAAQACIDEFITTELPERYQTNVGERGVRFSGGQRQRIGIARALYANPSVLFLDEATSALDKVSADSVMNTIYDMRGQRTVIIIAHNLETVSRCDKIFHIENGSLVSEGSSIEVTEMMKNS